MKALLKEVILLENKPFQENLRKEILIYSLGMITLVIIILSIIIAGLNRVLINIEMENSEQYLQEFILSNIDQHEQVLLTNRNTSFLDYLNGDVPESKVYSDYYRFNSQQTLKSDLLIMDNDMEVAFSSNQKWDNNGIFMNYLSVISDKLSADSLTTQRLYLDRDREHYLVLMTPIGNLDEPEGYALHLINGKEVSSQLNQIQSDYIITDKFDNVFSASSNQFISGALEKAEITKLGNRFYYNEDLYYSRGKSLTPELKLHVYQQSFMYPSFIYLSGTIVCILSLLMLAFAMAFSKRISLRNAKSVELLSKEMKRLKHNPDHRLAIHTNDEFETVSDRINIMLEELSLVHEKNLTLLQENLLTERKKLEAQFHPHFLYNTLEVIRASLTFDKDIANQLILRLTKILRYSIDENSSEVTLETDLAYIEEYLIINQIRFQHFEFEYDVDEEALDVPVPKLFLMPLIENSLKYGFRLRPDLKIIIKAKKKKDHQFNIQIIDNGNTLDAAECDLINDRLQKNGPMGNHHGLLNSKRRLQIMYPEADFQLRVEDGYTIVDILIRGIDDV